MFGLLMHLFLYYSQTNQIDKFDIETKTNLVHAQKIGKQIQLENIKSEELNKIKENISAITQNQFLPLAKIIENHKIPHKINPYNVGVDLTAQNYVLLDYETMLPLYQKNSDKVVSIASITKLMTALVIINEDINLDNHYYYKEEDPALLGYRYVYKGDKLKLRDLFNTALVGSDNTALTLLVKATGISQKEFILKMNDLAKKINLKNTSFVEITGLDSKNKSTANDIAKLLKYISENNQDLFLVTNKNEYRFKPLNSNKIRRVYNTNQLLVTNINKNPFKVELGKTGFIDEAGYCLSTIIFNKKVGRKVIAVALNSETNDDRFEDIKDLVLWGFDNYEWR